MEVFYVVDSLGARGAADRLPTVRIGQTRGVPMILGFVFGLLILLGLFLACGAFIGAIERL